MELRDKLATNSISTTLVLFLDKVSRSSFYDNFTFLSDICDKLTPRFYFICNHYSIGQHAFCPSKSFSKMVKDKMPQIHVAQTMYLHIYT